MKFGPNLNEFVSRFESDTTDGQGKDCTTVSQSVSQYCYTALSVGPYRLKNLYFSYLVVLRAVTKAESYWRRHQFYTGNAEVDATVKSLLLQLVAAAK